MPSSARFLGVLDPPENAEDHQTTSLLDELDESDVVWSSYTPTAPSSDVAISESYPPTPLSTSSSSFSAASSASPRQFLAPTAGLSAAMGFGDRHSRSPVVQRKKTARSPLLSAARAAAVTAVFARPPPSTSPISRSAPVKVPIWTDSRWIGKGGRGFDPTAVMEGFDEEVDEGSDDGEMVPPHEIVARSHRTTTFSVFEGVGRTLKGRDLTRMRNTVMQKTGFLE